MSGVTIFNIIKWTHAAVFFVTLQESERVRFPMVSLEFFIDIIVPAALRPWGRLNL